ncbi:MAG: TVP38/TMEM64 family protein [Deltaproteobacteria bacterium]|nr:TVP38/TMEM64 family protein [Deltaproteobacteria bacterium]
MNRVFTGRRVCIVIAAILCAALIYHFREAIAAAAANAYDVFSDREKSRAFITQFGIGAPPAFMGIQVLQVIFAPVPGEATGFIGGYLFGTLPGFIYSSIALTLGSLINFKIGRFLGRRWIRKLIPVKYMDKLDFALRHQGAVVVFIFFIIPGFPKDYLSLFLGLSTLPLRVFILLAAIGRMPGTLMLSLQGASLYEKNYSLLAVLCLACLVIVFLAYRYRDSLYRWIERQNQKK